MESERLRDPAFSLWHFELLKGTVCPKHLARSVQSARYSWINLWWMNRKNVSRTTSVTERAFESGMLAFLADLLTGRNPRMRRILVSPGCFQENEAESVTDRKKECQGTGWWIARISKTGGFLQKISKCHCVWWKVNFWTLPPLTLGWSQAGLVRVCERLGRAWGSP